MTLKGGEVTLKEEAADSILCFSQDRLGNE